MDTTITTAKGIISKIARQTIESCKSKNGPVYHANAAMYSPPGVGKSSIVQQIADALNIPMIDVRLVCMESADVQGIPFVRDQKDMAFSTPSWFPVPDDESLDDDDPRKSPYGILLFDELTNAHRQTQQAAYRIFLDRSIQNGRKLPDGWIIVAAGNRKEDKTGSNDLPYALANRFAVHLHIRADKDAFLAYAAERNIHHHVTGFISFKPEYLHVFDPKHMKDEAYPTPRTWEFVSRHLYMDYDDEELALVLAGCIGDGAAAEFLGFRKFYAEMPDFEKIIAGKEQYKVPNDSNPGVIFALVSSLLSYTFECVIKKNAEGTENLGKVLLQIPNEYLTLFWKQFKAAFEAKQASGELPSNMAPSHVHRTSPSMQESFHRIRKYLRSTVQ